MPNPRLASRYAKSLMDIAVGQNSVEAVLNDLKTLDDVCQKNRDFAVMLRSPVVKADKKLAVFNAVFSGHISNLTMAFVKLMTQKGREEYLQEIVQAFIAQYNEMKHIKVVKLTTAAPVNDKVKNAILGKVAHALEGNTIDLRTAVKPELIGGFVLEVEDKLFDASVRRDLNDIRTTLLDNSYISKM
ncbi:MAG: ATP synthase F1 subunit delta [Bacteroidetes bacterium 46-16]|nr:MAG: ATP synthase F1 subunit delta [Bacteroidetes bacterium 46-16]